jgi:hypothetical protein
VMCLNDCWGHPSGARYGLPVEAQIAEYLRRFSMLN